MNKTKPYFRKKGTYKDGRTRIAIEIDYGKKKINRALPKPEKLLKILDGLKSDKNCTEKLDGQMPCTFRALNSQNIFDRMDRAGQSEARP